MDPNLQVAIVGVFATLITTTGVVVVALINNKKERTTAASAGVEAGLDEKDVLERMLSLMQENERCQEKIDVLEVRLAARDEEIRRLRAENTQLRIGHPNVQLPTEEDQ